MTPNGSSRPVVLHLVTMLELGGAQETTLATVRLLSRDSFEPVLIFGPGGILDAEALAIPGVQVIPVPSLIREVSPPHDLRALLSLRRTIARFVRRGVPVIVHTHSSKAGILGRWAARLAGADVIVHTVHGFGFNPWQTPPARSFFQWIERVTARITHSLIFVSEANREEAARLGIRPRGEAELIRSALPVADFFPDRGRGEVWRRREGIPEKAPLVGMVSCLKRQKAPVEFVHLAGRLAGRFPEVRFVLAGDGELRREVEAAAAEAGLGERLRILGWRRDIPELLRALDCQVLTSRWEGLPKAVVEGLLSGVPVVANEVDGVGEVIARWGGGYTVAAGDLDGMARRVAGILDGSAPVGAVDRSSLAGEFDEAAMVRRHEELYRRLIDARGRRG
jgi:glycosyltransferase involved in cell wall biosynthesis